MSESLFIFLAIFGKKVFLRTVRQTYDSYKTRESSLNLSVFLSENSSLGLERLCQ